MIGESVLENIKGFASSNNDVENSESDDDNSVFESPEDNKAEEPDR